MKEIILQYRKNYNHLAKARNKNKEMTICSFRIEHNVESSFYIFASPGALKGGFL